MMRIRFIAAAVIAIVVVAVGLATPAAARPTNYDPAKFVVWAEATVAGNAHPWSVAKIRKQADAVCAHGKSYVGTLKSKGLSASQAKQFAANAKSWYCPPSAGKPSSGDAVALG